MLFFYIYIYTLMASNRILSSKALNKLQVNRLDAQAIRSDYIIPESPSYLFSAVFNNANFSRNSSGGTLTFTRSDVHSIIQFSDRPFRQTGNINFQEFVNLFDTTGDNSFEQDPPNAVLVHQEEQRTYVVRLVSNDSKAKFNLKLLRGQMHNMGDVSGRMSLFVDMKVMKAMKAMKEEAASAVFNNANFSRNSTGGTLTFTRSDVDSIIQFSDRPFRQTQNIDYDTFISLFHTTGDNSFEQHIPNAVLVHQEEQRTYVVRLVSNDSKAKFNLKLLRGQMHNMGDVSGRMSLFVDMKAMKEEAASAVFNNANFSRNSTGGTLTFTRSDVDSIIQFSDRPFRQTQNIDYDTFISLFHTTGDNSFEQHIPNAVLVHQEEQRTYVVRLVSNDSKAKFNLKLLRGQMHNMGDVSGRMSLFVDMKVMKVEVI